MTVRCLLLFAAVFALSAPSNGALAQAPLESPADIDHAGGGHTRSFHHGYRGYGYPAIPRYPLGTYRHLYGHHGGRFHPAITHQWFVRPYPYHLDYFRLRYPQQSPPGYQSPASPQSPRYGYGTAYGQPPHAMQYGNLAPAEQDYRSRPAPPPPRSGDDFGRYQGAFYW